MNQKVKNIETKILSDNWYTLNKISFEYRLKTVNGLNNLERVMIEEMVQLYCCIIN